MKICITILYLISIIAVPLQKVSGQGGLPYSFTDLGGKYYLTLQNEIRKNKPAAAIFSDKKAQKKYTELHDERRKTIISGFTENNFVYQKDIADYLAAIAADLQKSNTSLFPEQPVILLDRSDVVNAYALGDNIVVINMGLLLFVQSREELALILAHELSHNILRHSENSLKETAARLSSDEYNDSINAVLDSRYERLSRLKKIVIGYSANRSRHSRYHEASADSLAISLLKKSGISFDARFFLRLDSVNEVTQQKLRQPVKHYFDNYKLQFDESWLKQAKGLSSRNYQFRDSTEINEDSLKTHPDCVIRYEKTRSQTDTHLVLTPVPASLQEICRKIIVWNKVNALDLTPALYYVFSEKDNTNDDPWYDFIAGVVFSILNYAEKDLNRFNAVGSRQKEYVATTYYDLQNSLTRMSRGVLDANCSTIQQQSRQLALQLYEKELLHALQMLSQEQKPDRKRIEQISRQAFQSPGNPYLELFNSLSKK